MIAKSVGWTMGGSPTYIDPVEFDINKLGPDEVLVKIGVRKAKHPDLDKNCGSEDSTHETQEVCRGDFGLVVEAGANALWYVDRSVIIPAKGRCESCDASQHDRAMARFHQEAAENGGDVTPAKFVILRASELCVASVIVDWQKPTST
jgi:hypothetical protein